MKNIRLTIFISVSLDTYARPEKQLSGQLHLKMCELGDAVAKE